MLTIELRWLISRTGIIQGRYGRSLELEGLLMEPLE